MNKNFFLILFSSLIALSASVKVEQNDQYFVQFRINTVSDNDQAMKVDHKMNNKSGIANSRTDYITSTYFCILNPGSDYNKDDFESWFENLGFSISCFHKGINGIDDVVSPHELKDCQDEE